MSGDACTCDSRRPHWHQAPASTREDGAGRADVDLVAAEVAGYERGLRDAIGVVHAEARWQWELDGRRVTGAQIVAQRLGVVDQILTDWLNSKADQ